MVINMLNRGIQGKRLRPAIWCTPECGISLRAGILLQCLYGPEEQCGSQAAVPCVQGCHDREALEGAASQLREYLEEVEVIAEEALFEVLQPLVSFYVMQMSRQCAYCCLCN